MSPTRPPTRPPTWSLTLPRLAAAPVLFAVLVVLVLQAQSSDANPPCRLPRVPDGCTYGRTRDFCSNVVCAKGPGEKCGGPYNVEGRCGEGMQCLCGKCTGCSVVTLQCHARSSCPL
ncbi:hypothetical protein ONE63_006815 [Megalurothrips usitatus]|uniref:Neuroparsin-A-like n=1 Tax=Megalurothrips usitatus TaxID=439358 RepID=A0AAV7XSL6_9NEOP|nr:hypothetical protein ONE63_006815 [Megalurothrips usitatus]